MAVASQCTLRRVCPVALLLLGSLIACAEADDATAPANSAVDNADVIVSAADPDTVTVDTTVTVRIIGSGFTEGSIASWIIDTAQAPGILTLSTSYKSPTELEALIAVSPDAELRTYRIRVRSKKGKQGIGVERFRVVAKPVPLPEPGVTSQAMDVNDSGVIVGYGADALGAPVALRWTPVDTGWTYTALGAGSAVAVNNDGLIVRRDYDRVTGIWHSWIHLASGAVVDLGSAYVIDISDNGTVIGSVTDSSWNSIAVAWRRVSAVTWGSPQPLPIPQGYSKAWHARINAAGDIAGTAYTDSTTAPAVWRYSQGQWHTPELVDTELQGGSITINDGGAVAGWTWPCIRGLSTCHSSPALWSSPGAPRRILPTLYNHPGSVFGMNNANQVVGVAYVHYNDGSGPLAATVDHAVIWFPGSELPEDLGAILPWASGAGLAINNHGLVVGFVRDREGFPYHEHATIWQLPGTLSLPAERRAGTGLTITGSSRAAVPRR